MINAIVFDLDETIGHFTQLYTIWETLKELYVKKKSLNDIKEQELFNYVLDSLDNFMRPLIMEIFKYLREKKTKLKNLAVMIYTNNNGPKKWTLMIKNYIHYKLNSELFDNIICAFKVDGKVIEPCRTSHQKTYNDLMRCTSITKTTQIFFIDDQYHEKMKHENIYYIKIKPYIFEYSFDEVCEQLKNRHIILFIKDNIGMSQQYFIAHFKALYTKKYPCIVKPHSHNKINYNIDLSVGKQIMKHLKDFLFDIIESRQTRKKPNSDNNSKNRTKKKYFSNKTRIY